MEEEADVWCARYAFETSTAFFQLFLAFALGLDPRVQSSVGATLSPLLIGIVSALSIFCTGFVKEGYLGAGESCVLGTWVS